MKYTYKNQSNALYVSSYKWLLLVILIIFNNYTIFSQKNPGNVNNYTVWMQNTDTSNKDAERFLNFHQPIEKIKKHIIKNVIKDQYSLFLVFSSKGSEEEKMIKVVNGDARALLTNKKIISFSEKPYDKKVTNGIFVSLLSQQVSRRGFKNYLKIYKDILKNEDTKIYEVLYYPRRLNSEDLAKVQTYFAIKYGVSLPEESVYLNYKGDTIWNPKENKGFNSKVTGIANDNDFNLKQFKSQNSEFKNLSIAFNKKSINTKDKKFYLLFGDNGKAVKFNLKTDTDFQILNRVWKVNSTSNISNFDAKASFDLALQLDESTINPEEDLWMLINDNTVFDTKNTTFIKGVLKNGVYHFKDVAFSKEQSYFSFAKIPPMHTDIVATQASCSKNEAGKIDLTILGGVPPYTVQINSDELSQEETTRHQITFSDLTAGDYSLTIQDRNGMEQIAEVQMTSNDDLGLVLKSKWILKDSQKEVAVHFNQNEQSDHFEYYWYFNDELLSTEQTFNAEQCGIYNVVVKNENGCQQKATFSVETQADLFATAVLIYPNPVVIGDRFNVSFAYDELTNVTVSIYSLEGKLLLSDNFNGITKFSKFYTINATSSAVYWLVVKSNNTYTTKKIILK